MAKLLKETSQSATRRKQKPHPVLFRVFHLVICLHIVEARLNKELNMCLKLSKALGK